MDVTLAQSDLTKILFLCQGIAEKKATMPIFGNLLITAGDGKLKICASNGEITMVAATSAKVTSVGSTTVNAKVFADIVKELPTGDVQLKLGAGERIEVLSGKSKWKVIGISSDEYPSLSGIGFSTSGRVRANQLCEMISHTIYAVSSDETRFNINGVCFELGDSSVGPKNGSKRSATELRLIATDGHRLALVTRQLESTSGFDFRGNVIVPRKGLSEIKKLLEAEGERDIGIAITEGFLIIEGQESKISVRLIDGEFPDYHQVLPNGNSEQFTIKCGSLHQALRRVALIVPDKSKCVRLDVSKDKLILSCHSQSLGDAREELPLESDFTGKPVSVGFNALYMLDVAASIPEDHNISFELHGELGPGKISPVSDSSYFAIVMPMRLADN